MYCGNCGKLNADNIKFCGNCGTLMEGQGSQKSDEVQQPGETANIINTQPVQEQTYQQTQTDSQASPYQASVNQQRTYQGTINANASGNQYQSNTNFADANLTKPVTVGEWIVTFLIMSIPLVNIIMVFVWAFGGGVNISKRNFFRAELILMLIMFGISIIILILLFALGVSFYSTSYHYSI
jgi:hypothetical protein